MYSSGTTGRPKGVALTQANMIAHMINAHGGWCLDDGDKYMVSMPLFHVGGSSWLQFAVYDGTPIVMTRDADIESVSEAIRQGANRTFLVPAVLAQVLQAGGDAVKLVGRLETDCYRGAPLPLALPRAAPDDLPGTGLTYVYCLTGMCCVSTELP